jgi:predicted RNase H-like nuclease (RuvC/YqgF family)
MSDNASVDNRENGAVKELEVLVRHLADELAGFRRRALVAESRLKELESHDGNAASVDLVNRCAELERENERLQSRLETATTRAKQMLDRVKFLRQQAQAGGAGGSGA